MLTFPLSTPQAAKVLGVRVSHLRYLIVAGKAVPDVLMGHHAWTREQLAHAAQVLKCDLTIRNRIAGFEPPAAGTKEGTS